MNKLVQEWKDAIGAADQTGMTNITSLWIGRVVKAGEALAKDYALVCERANREAEGRLRVHSALAEAIGGEAASRINDDPPTIPRTD